MNFKKWNQITVEDCFTFPVNQQRHPTHEIRQNMQQNRHSWVECDGSMLQASANDCAHFLDQNRPTNPDGDKDDQ